MAKEYGQACPVARALDLVGERWTLLIVRDLLHGPARFQDLRTQLPGIPPKLLSDRLRALEEQDVIARQVYSEHPPRASYSLTERGRGLGVIVGALATWGRAFVGKGAGPTHAECGHVLQVAHYCPHCDARVDPTGVKIVRAPRVPAARTRRRRRPRRRQPRSPTP